ncbi:Uncharacterised protein [Vibrio cholerae]|nr:Uncharacterised protein [Vibrio cholerae]
MVVEHKEIGLSFLYSSVGATYNRAPLFLSL